MAHPVRLLLPAMFLCGWSLIALSSAMAQDSDNEVDYDDVTGDGIQDQIITTCNGAEIDPGYYVDVKDWWCETSGSLRFGATEQSCATVTSGQSQPDDDDPTQCWVCDSADTMTYTTHQEIRYDTDHAITITVSDGGCSGGTSVGDYDGDGIPDAYQYNRSSGSYTITDGHGNSSTYTVGYPGDYDTTNNYSSPTCQDLTSYDSESRTYSSQTCGSSSSTTVTVPGDGAAVAASADYDGDGLADYAAFDRYTDTLTYISSRDGSTQTASVGQAGDIPLPGHYLSGSTDQFAVYRPTTGSYLVWSSLSGAPTEYAFGPNYAGSGWVPSPVYYNHSATLSPALYNAYDQMYAIWNGGGKPIAAPSDSSLISVRAAKTSVARSVPVGRSRADDNTVIGLPDKVQIPASLRPYLMTKVPLDFDGDRRTDLTMFGTGNTGVSQVVIDTSNVLATYFGVNRSGDIIVAGDYDGDGATEPAFIRARSDGALEWHWVSGGSDHVVVHGRAGDKVVVGDFDCDQKTDPAVVREVNGTLQWIVRLSTTGQAVTTTFGTSGSTAFAADVNGDTCDEMITAQTANGTVTWHAQGISQTKPEVDTVFGQTGDQLMVPMDMDGDSRADYLVGRVVSGKLMVFVQYANGSQGSFEAGLPGDVAMTGFYSGVNRAEVAAYRASGRKFILHKFNGSVQEVTLGTSSAQLAVLPEGVAVKTTGERVVSVAVPADKFGCQQYLANKDGKGKYQWFPGASGNAQPVFYSPLSLYQSGTKTVDLLTSAGKRLQTMKYIGKTKLSQAAYRGSLTQTKIVKGGGKSVIVRFRNGDLMSCIKYTQSTKKWD